MTPSEDHRITENGNRLAQEDGKPDRLPRQDSQMQHTLSSYSDYQFESNIFSHGVSYFFVHIYPKLNLNLFAPSVDLDVSPA